MTTSQTIKAETDEEVIESICFIAFRLSFSAKAAYDRLRQHAVQHDLSMYEYRKLSRLLRKKLASEFESSIVHAEANAETSMEELTSSDPR